MTFWRPSHTGKRPGEMENALRRINATLAAFDEALDLSANDEMCTTDVLVPAGTDVRNALLRFERDYSDLIPIAHAARRELASATETAQDWGEQVGRNRALGPDRDGAAPDTPVDVSGIRTTSRMNPARG